MADYSGNFYAVDSNNSSLLWDSNIRVGSVSLLDRYNTFNGQGVIIADTITLPADTSVMQGTLIESFRYSFYDRTYLGGHLNIDGTYIDGTYLTRSYDPLWVNYSVWYQTPPTGVPEELVGYPTRVAQNLAVGQYTANMIAGVPGNYEIRWRYQKDQSSLAREVDIPFTVTTWGIDAQPSYS